MSRGTKSGLLDPTTAQILDMMSRAHEVGINAVKCSIQRVLLCVETGDLLRRKKAELGHGHFLDWFDNQIGDTELAVTMDFSIRTARNWMKVSELKEQGLLNLDDAGSVKRLYQLAGVLPDAEEGSGGTADTNDEPMPLVKLKRLHTMLESELARHPIDKWTNDEKRVWRDRLKPFYALYKALS